MTVGFNRRYSPHILQIKKELDRSNAPKSIIYTCNAGFIDSSHWINNPLTGGGRLIGEACHF